MGKFFQRFLVVGSLITILSFFCSAQEPERTKEIIGYDQQKNYKEYTFETDGIVLRVSPRQSSAWVVNTVTTEIMGETVFSEVDTTVVVVVLETSGVWSKVRVTIPTHLSETHQGWVLTRLLVPRYGR